MEKPIEIFCCYARKDHLLLLELKKHLMPFQHEGLIILRTDLDISPGEEWKQKIDQRLGQAQIILLLISPDFMDSNYCYSIEMKRAMEQHQIGKVRVIPIILRPVRWQEAPFGQLRILPTNGEPVTNWPGESGRDNAFVDVTRGIQKVIEDLDVQNISKNEEEAFYEEISKERFEYIDEQYKEPFGIFENFRPKICCPYCFASIRGTRRYSVEWDGNKKEFQVQIVYDCPDCKSRFHEERIKRLPLVIAQQSSCSCGSELSLANYSLRKVGKELEFEAIYFCQVCSTRKCSSIGNLMQSIFDVWKNITKVELGLSGLKYPKKRIKR